MLKIRLIHWKKQWISLTFWLLFPLLATIGSIQIANILQTDSKIPVGIVLEEHTDDTAELLHKLRTTPFINVTVMQKEDALHQLQQHNLDSVFIVRQGYSQNVQKGSRNHLLTSYTSDLSIAYTPIKEILISFIQQKTGRVKTAFTVQQLSRQYHAPATWPVNEIIDKSKEIQTNAHLITTAFTFTNSKTKLPSAISFMNAGGFFAIISILSALMIFDWVIHESREEIRLRISMTRYSFHDYLLLHFIIYTACFLMIDIFSLWMLNQIWHVSISIPHFIMFRILLNLAVFLTASQFKQTFLYYAGSFAITLLLAVTGGAILPEIQITGKWQWLHLLNPVRPLLTGGWINISSIIILGLAIIWYCRKENFHASG